MTGPLPSPVSIRTATVDDAATVHGFIVDLAIYEREPDAVEATVETLAGQLAMDHPPFECILASMEVDGVDTDVGMALFFPIYSTWTGRVGIHLEDLYVARTARGHGAGLALLQHVAALTLQRGGRRLAWAVLDWNTPSIEFYDDLGATPQSDWITYRLAGDALAAVVDRA